MAEAYSVFANGGKRKDSHLITKIVGPTGNTIAKHNSETTRVTSKKVAKEMSSMLLGVVGVRYRPRCANTGIQLAGKTGSTQLPYPDIDGTKDQWFVGYTPDLVGAVWLGYDKRDRLHYLPQAVLKRLSLYLKESWKECNHLWREMISIGSIPA